MKFLRNIGIVISLVVATTAHSQGTVIPNVSVGQTIADELRQAANADIAFFPNSHVKEKKESKDVQSYLEYPDDALWLITLTGRQIRAGLEKSIAYYPQPSASQLHISGLTVSFVTGRSERIESISIENGSFDNNKVYKIAMPASLARGGLGFFGLWEFQKPERLISSNLTKLLEGKSVQSSVSRWQYKGSL